MKVITVARKPLAGSVADTCLKYGTGGLNIDACRIPINGEKTQRLNKGVEWRYRKPEYYVDRSNELFGSPLGRFPANLILITSDDIIRGFPDVVTGTVKPYRHLNRKNICYGTKPEFSTFNKEGDSGSAARFFKQVKE